MEIRQKVKCTEESFKINREESLFIYGMDQQTKYMYISDRLWETYDLWVLENKMAFFEKVAKLRKIQRENVPLCQSFTLEAFKQFVCWPMNNHQRFTDQQVVVVVLATNTQPWNWYKCPNGHGYPITAWGRIMECQCCLICNSVIICQVTPEMDGSQHSAWSETNNLQNFVSLTSESHPRDHVVGLAGLRRITTQCT